MSLIRFAVLVAFALFVSAPASAQTTYPTAGWTLVQDINFNPPLRGTANTLVEIVTLTASVTGSVYCNLQGYTGS